jgi:rhamnosyltransferase
MKLTTKKTDISIVIPAFNEEAYIAECLEAIFAQEIPFKFEVLVIDSGSTDNTLSLVKNFPQVKIIQIKPEEFGHGRTRNLGVRNSIGDFIVFLNADAIPVNNQWLKFLVEEIKSDDSLAGVFSRHLPRPEAYQYVVRDLIKSMPDKKRIKSKAKKFDFMLFSTVSAAIPRQIWQQYPFDDGVAIAEDQNWARTVIDRGYKVAYIPESLVYHSHNYSLKDLYKIKKQVSSSLKGFKSRVWAACFGFFILGGNMISKILGDVGFILTRNIGFGKKMRELRISFLARVVSFAGRYIGSIS